MHIITIYAKIYYIINYYIKGRDCRVIHFRESMYAENTYDALYITTFITIYIIVKRALIAR